ncbi:cobalamin-independent methionine synthase [Frankia torreyi]|uniref:Cobalamin-independent methionine synthase n=1 Tax=Frankia torreyi TaxID=1856 RepID=A0A0D8BDN0_9ACTN|nr:MULTISPECIES: methionine synthase [Frankia]KJE22079.1 cobalamin-independent methionine synthase [Frankia torreyi]KQC36139.1 methionine synthase [Frankia sp. ACN1ag]
MSTEAGPAPLWPAGAATGVGSLPGTDPVEATKSVFDELPDLPHLPELPARGPGAAMIGRSAAILLDLPVDLQPAGWRLVPRPGLDLRRSRDLLRWDLDALTEVAAGYSGPLKVAVAGPWTLAAELELPRGHKALSDAGATRDLAEALAAGLADHLGDIARRVPDARLVLQLDEPSLPLVLAGRVRTPSGFSVVPAVEEGLVVQRLRALADATRALAGVAGVGVHCCAADVPLAALRGAGMDFVGLDAALLTRAQDDAVGELVEAGVRLIAGLVATRGGAANLSDVRRTVEPVTALWSRLGFRPEQLGEVVAVAPACGLAGFGVDEARAVMRHCRRAGRVLVDAPA